MRFDGGINLFFHWVLSFRLSSCIAKYILSGESFLLGRTKRRQAFFLRIFLDPGVSRVHSASPERDIGKFTCESYCPALDALDRAAGPELEVLSPPAQLQARHHGIIQETRRTVLGFRQANPRHKGEDARSTK